MEDEHVVDRRVLVADGLGESLGGLHRETGQIERRIECDLADGDGARRGMAQDLADREILEEIADVDFFGASRASASM